MKRTFIGLFFILLACMTIIGESNIFPHGSVFLVVCTLFFGYLAIKGLKDFRIELLSYRDIKEAIITHRRN